MEDKKTEAKTELKPGETIRPGQSDAPVQAAELPAPVARDREKVDQSSAAESSDVDDSIPTGLQPAADNRGDDPDQVTWTASEFMDHAKSADWYLALAVVAILAAAALYFLFKDIITSVTPLVAALALGFYGRRRPRQLQYRLDLQGLTIGDKFFPYSLFRSFAVMEEGPFASIAFLPMKRFGMLTTVYLDPEDEDNIIELIGQHLPFEPRDHDVVDRFMNRIRF